MCVPIFLFLAVSTCSLQSAQGVQITAVVPDPVVFHCPADPGCGDIHSVKWYRGQERLFVFSPLTDFRKSEGFLADRSSLEVGEGGLDLIIHTSQLTDEGDYRCEISFLDASTECPVVQEFSLSTLAPPTFISLSVGGQETLQETGPPFQAARGAAGPYDEGAEVEVSCAAGGGARPHPTITWLLNSEELEEGVRNEEEEGGSKSHLTISLDRTHLGALVVCRVSSEAMDEHAELSLELDIEVPPTELSLEASEMTAGDPAHLDCWVRGARPAASLTWTGIDGSAAQETVVLEADLTYTTHSRLEFLPTHKEDGVTVLCSVEHSVLASPLEQELSLDVKYPPIVTTDIVNGSVLEGSEFFVSCLFAANPVNLTQVNWYRNGEELADSSDLTLTVVAARELAGEYTCRLSNAVGEGSSQPIHIDILYPPKVSVEASTDTVMEGDNQNVTLQCVVEAGNPRQLDSVLWFFEATQLSHLEGCSDGGCNLVVEPADRTAHGSYSCSGVNLAGEGQQSDSLHLTINYPPSEATILPSEGLPVKDSNFTLTCQVEDLGRPEATAFIWTRDGEVLASEEGAELELGSLSLAMWANYSCSAVNLAGSGGGDNFHLEIFAPPRVIASPPALVTAIPGMESLELTCMVECHPACNIQWWINAQHITGDSSLEAVLEATQEDSAALFKDYEVTQSEDTANVTEAEAEMNEEEVPAAGEAGEQLVAAVEAAERPFTVRPSSISPSDLEEDLFPTVTSVLSLDLGNLTAEVLEELQFGNVSCVAEENVAGPSVFAATQLFIEYGPQDLVVSSVSVQLIEGGTASEPVMCTATGYPEPEISWSHEGEVVSRQQQLEFPDPVERSAGGEYTCTASSPHGSLDHVVHVEVLYPPTCVVTKEFEEKELKLICTADGNPQDYVFWWRKENITFEGQAEGENANSVRLQIINETIGVYSCHVRNSVGTSLPCTMDIDGTIFFLHEESTLIAAVVAVIFLLLLILLILYCFLRRPKAKQHNEKDDKLPHPDQSFYEGLPFHGLKNPPKQVLHPVDDDLVYADVDHTEIYAYGPLSYKAASLQRAKERKKLLESKL